MFDTAYFDREMAYLRDAGRKFASLHPQRASALRLDSGDFVDPHIERMIESFAFLTSRIQQRLDDDFSEFCDTILSVLCPPLVNPIPAFTILEFFPLEGFSKTKSTIHRGATVESAPIGEREEICTFRTTSEVQLLPIHLADLTFGKEPGQPSYMRAVLKVLGGENSRKIDWSTLRFYIHGDLPVYGPLFSLLHKEVERVLVHTPVEVDRPVAAEVLSAAKNLSCSDYTKEESLLPLPAYVSSSFCTLYEYFLFPEKTRFFDLEGLEFLKSWDSFSTLYLDFQLRSDPPMGLRVGRENLRLFCTPAVNLFQVEGLPVTVEQNCSAARVEPAMQRRNRYDIYSVEAVSTVDNETGETIQFSPLLGFLPMASTPSGRNLSFHIDRRILANGETEHWLRFVDRDGYAGCPSVEGLSIALTCTDGELAGELLRGDLTIPGDLVDESIGVHNLLTPTTPAPAPLARSEKLRLWELLGTFNTNLLSVANASVLKDLIQLMAHFAGAIENSESGKSVENRRSLSWRGRLASIQEVSTDFVMDIVKGCPLRGTKMTIAIVSEKAFEERGELLQFMAVLSQFLAHYCPLNSFVDLELVCKQPMYQETWSWRK